MDKTPKTTPSKPIPVNPALVWDYEIPPEENQTDTFRRWYLSRVLIRGNNADLRAVGLETIYAFLPHLILPAEIRRFWEWYFTLPEVKPRYDKCWPLFSATYANRCRQIRRYTKQPPAWMRGGFISWFWILETEKCYLKVGWDRYFFISTEEYSTTLWYLRVKTVASASEFGRSRDQN